MITGRPLYGYGVEGAEEGHYVADPAARLSLCGIPLESIPLWHQPPTRLCWPCRKAAKTTPPAMADTDD